MLRQMEQGKGISSAGLSMTREFGARDFEIQRMTFRIDASDHFAVFLVMQNRDNIHMVCRRKNETGWLRRFGQWTVSRFRGGGVTSNQQEPMNQTVFRIAIENIEVDVNFEATKNVQLYTVEVAGGGNNSEHDGESGKKKNSKKHKQDMQASKLRWRCSQFRTNKTLRNTIVSDTVKQELIDPILYFLSPEGRESDSQTGMPHRRGFLLKGPPGCGKTSLVKAMAGDVGLNVYQLDLDACYSAMHLNGLLADIATHETGKPHILLFDDFDKTRMVTELLKKNNDRYYGGKDDDDLTLAGFLPAIDGVNEGHGRICFFCVNSADKLDFIEAFRKRPGRIDREIDIGMCDQQMYSKMFELFTESGVIQKRTDAPLELLDQNITPCVVMNALCMNQGKTDEEIHQILGKRCAADINADVDANTTNSNNIPRRKKFFRHGRSPPERMLRRAKRTLSHAKRSIVQGQKAEQKIQEYEKNVQNKTEHVTVWKEKRKLQATKQRSREREQKQRARARERASKAAAKQKVTAAATHAAAPTAQKKRTARNV